ncbi:MAG: GTP-binding protein [Lachnospiraceae bacterium]|nr:GTP-binding protein [Lachnospiraceae bacterium]
MKGLLKFITCGSVDDGKSTLIGHILYDSKLIYADQERALELDSKVGSRGGAIDYSLLLDGLMAEREQGITIDVAYRYFTTENRSFIVADTPGHEEYTRNMAVGASFADLAVILVDATQGVLVQTRRHARICALMGIRYFVFAVNKMDLVDYSEERFQEIETQIEALKTELGLFNIRIIPVSATEGDNVTVTSAHTGWYDGPALLTYLEQVDVAEDSLFQADLSDQAMSGTQKNRLNAAESRFYQTDITDPARPAAQKGTPSEAPSSEDTPDRPRKAPLADGNGRQNPAAENPFYMPVQRVCRPNYEFRGFQGQIEEGIIRIGDEITALPSRERAHVKRILAGDSEKSEAFRGQPVTIQLDREVDVSRGCVLTAGEHLSIASGVTADILWMDDEPLINGKAFFIKIGTRLVPGQVRQIRYSTDVNTGEKHRTEHLLKNEIGSVEIVFADSVVLDLFQRHKTLGELILIDRITNMTSACGVVTSTTQDQHENKVVTAVKRALLNGHTAAIVKFSPEADGITLQLVQEVEYRLYMEGRRTFLYQPGPNEDVDRILELLTEAGLIVLLVENPGVQIAENPSFYTGWKDADTRSASEIARAILRETSLVSEGTQDGGYL